MVKWECGLIGFPTELKSGVFLSIKMGDELLVWGLLKNSLLLAPVEASSLLGSGQFLQMWW